MQPLVRAVLLAALACAAPVHRTEGPHMLFVHDEQVELSDKPVSIALPLRDASAALRAVADDPDRALMLRIERISIDRQPGVTYRVDVGGLSVGILAFYGAEESNGTFMAAFTADEAVARALERDAKNLTLTFTPQGSFDEHGKPNPVHLEGHARFTRVTFVSE
ncbi:MAG TPA: hypothetical protein VFN10_21805 [Thermoanaerobaculia bacterium]|nr:hypothetical protein [Thermoanaerobaculia bacterium]